MHRHLALAAYPLERGNGSRNARRGSLLTAFTKPHEVLTALSRASSRTDAAQPALHSRLAGGGANRLFGRRWAGEVPVEQRDRFTAQAEAMQAARRPSGRPMLTGSEGGALQVATGELVLRLERRRTPRPS